MLMAEQNLFDPEQDTSVEYSPPQSDGSASITWTASEFITNNKNIGWYAMFLFSIIVLCLFIYLFTRSLFSSIAIFILGVTISYVASRKPLNISYSLNSHGITINNITHHFSEYKSYNLISDENVEHIALMSVKRFTPNKVVYFESQDRDRITSLLGEFLPLETTSNDQVGKIMKKIGF
jgi:hypothetical protein